MNIFLKHDPFEALQDVCDQTTFLAFVKCLLADREDEIEKDELVPPLPYCPGANGWENTTVEDFLHAAITWAEDSEFGRKQGLDDDSGWKRFAEFLYAGKIYE